MPENFYRELSAFIREIISTKLDKFCDNIIRDFEVFYDIIIVTEKPTIVSVWYFQFRTSFINSTEVEHQDFPRCELDFFGSCEILCEFILWKESSIFTKMHKDNTVDNPLCYSDDRFIADSRIIFPYISHQLFTKT